MISNYEIKIENNEPILYLHFDFSNEIGGFKTKKQTIENLIKKYIKDNKINFKGVKIAIVVSGVLMGTLLLNEPIQDIEYYSPSVMETIVTETISNEIVKEDKQEVIEEVKQENKEEIKIEKPKEDNKKEKVKQESKKRRS